MAPDQFDATFVLAIDRDTAWTRLTEHPLDGPDGPARYWLPGFDASTTVIEDDRREATDDDAVELRVIKDDEPCAGTEIVVTLRDAVNGTRITVVQSRFGEWMPPLYDLMAVGWRHIVADLTTYLSTGVHVGRHVRPWGDLGAQLRPQAGGLLITGVHPGSLADRLGLVENDLLVVLAGAPVSCHDDLATVLRVLAGRSTAVEAEWVRDGSLETAVA